MRRARALAGAALIVVTLACLSACGPAPSAGDLCKLPGHTTQDADGHDMICGRDASNTKWVWVRVN